jgi:DNA (cytosine-5)-methyltransferase 1
MKFLSVCSGIEAASVAWHPLGWESVAYSEIEPFPCKVLQHHYPDVPNLGDMTKFKEWPDADVDVFVGGTPCQSFSVAGLRKGLDDPRGNLMLTYLAIAKRYRPNWLVWENVPGVLSSADGRDFGSLLGGLAILGYGFAYRVLDAQYFGVAQRRKRVFVVGYLGDWRPAAAVFFERHSLSGHPAPSREKGQRPTDSTSASPVYGGSDPNTSDTVTSKWAKGSGGPAGKECGLFVAQPIAFSGQMSNPQTDVNMTPTLGAKNPMAVAFAQNTRDEVREMPYVGALAAQPGMKQTSYIRTAMAVRRLTPVECERLQGFPDNYTDIKPKGKATPDGPRYKALGNSMAVPVMAWIGKRIQEVDAICKTQQNT